LEDGDLFRGSLVQQEIVVNGRTGWILYCILHCKGICPNKPVHPVSVLCVPVARYDVVGGGVAGAIVLGFVVHTVCGTSRSEGEG
jgi:hypothetical protein